MRSGSDYGLSMPEVPGRANPGMAQEVLLPLAYHAEDEIARDVARGEIVLAFVLIVIGIALMRRLEGAPPGRNHVARVAAAVAAVGIAAYALNKLIPYGDDPNGALVTLGLSLFFVEFAVGLVGPVLAILGLQAVRGNGERRLAVVAFIISLVLPGIFAANVVACAVTDACFH
jgi:hypothetical protein